MSVQPLPFLVLEKIFTKFSLKEKLVLRKVCRRWRSVVDASIREKIAAVPPLKFVISVELELQDLMTDYPYVHPIRCHVFRLTKYGEESVDYDVDFKWSPKELTDEAFWEATPHSPIFYYDRSWTVMVAANPAEPIVAFKTKLPVRAPNGKVYRASVLAIKKTSELADAYRWGPGPEIDLAKPLAQYQYDAQDLQRRKCCRLIRLLVPSATAPAPLPRGMRPPFVSVPFLCVPERLVRTATLAEIRKLIEPHFYIAIARFVGDDHLCYPGEAAPPTVDPKEVIRLVLLKIIDPSGAVLYDRDVAAPSGIFLETSNQIPVNYVTRNFPYYGAQ